MDLLLIAFLLLTAVVIGLISSMVGIGGNSLFIPILVIFLGLDIHIAIATMIFSSFFMASSSFIVYFKNKVVDFKLGLLMEAGAVPGAFLATHLSVLLPTVILTYIFVAAIIIVAVYMARSTRTKNNLTDDGCKTRNTVLKRYLWLREYNYKSEKATAVINIPLTIIGSFVIGLTVGLIGVAGGTVKVPFLNLICGIPMIFAVGTSFLMIIFTVISATAGYAFYGLISFSLAIPIIIGLIVGSQIGTRLALNLPQRKLKIIFSIVLALISILMVLT
ncbi:MAG: sulfite exporter TauE/SafE family protein [Candidatus Odinarchaeota archaeon]